MWVKTAAGHRQQVREIGERFEWNTHEMCKYLLSLDWYEQDAILRNPVIPWLNPQSNYVSPSTITLRFESYADWQFLLNVFRITGAEVTIREDYELDDETKRMIRQLYFEDDVVFRMYE